jgi:hypothetical protein
MTAERRSARPPEQSDRRLRPRLLAAGVATAAGTAALIVVIELLRSVLG